MEPEGRISPGDLGIWDDAHIDSLRGLAGVIKAAGAVPAVQIAHAGRKASTAPPFQGGGPLSPRSGGWPVVGPSDLAFSQESPRPHALSEVEITIVQDSFPAAATLADFSPLYGQNLMTRQERDSLAGILAELGSAGCETVPALSAHAMPGGRERPGHGRDRRFEAGLSRAGLRGDCLVLHTQPVPGLHAL